MQDDIVQMAELAAKGAVFSGPEAVQELSTLLKSFCEKHLLLVQQRLGRGGRQN